MKTLIQDALIIDPKSSFHDQRRSIFINNGRIEKIAGEIDVDENTKLINGADLMVTPTFFDAFVNFGEPGFEDRETLQNGLKAAAKGGFGDIILQSTTYPDLDHVSIIHQLQDKFKDESCHLHLSAALTKAKKGKDLSEIYELDEQGVKGFSDVFNTIDDPNLLKLALLYSQKVDQPIFSFPLDLQLADQALVHENLDTYSLGLRSMPAMAEEVRLERDIAILAYTGGRLHIPAISTKGSVAIIKKAKADGLQVTCGAAVHNICYTTKALQGFDTNFKVLPVLRDEDDRSAIMEGLRTGVIDMVSSMHYPRTIEEKDCEFEQAEIGSLGLESCFGMLLKHFDVPTSVELLTRGRKLFNIDHSPIGKGASASLVCFDRAEKTRIKASELISKAKNSMFLGEELDIKIKATFNHDNINIYG